MRHKEEGEKLMLAAIYRLFLQGTQTLQESRRVSVLFWVSTTAKAGQLLEDIKLTL